MRNNLLLTGRARGSVSRGAAVHRCRIAIVSVALLRECDSVKHATQVALSLSLIRATLSFPPVIMLPEEVSGHAREHNQCVNKARTHNML